MLNGMLKQNYQQVKKMYRSIVTKSPICLLFVFIFEMQFNNFKLVMELVCDMFILNMFISNVFVLIKNKNLYLTNKIIEIWMMPYYNLN